jgi:hypothetical protein
MQKLLAFFCFECSRWMTSESATEHRDLHPGHRLLHRDTIERRAQRLRGSEYRIPAAELPSEA